MDLALPAADLPALPKKAPLLKPLLHISGEVFRPAQGSHIDLHMLPMFFHERQIERIWSIVSGLSTQDSINVNVSRIGAI